MFESYLLSVAVLSLIGVEGNRAGFTGRQVCGEFYPSASLLSFCAQTGGVSRAIKGRFCPNVLVES